MSMMTLGKIFAVVGLAARAKKQLLFQEASACHGKEVKSKGEDK